MDKRRIMLKVAYDGTHYRGWQVQPNAPTIAGTLSEALSDLHGESIKLIGGSRTDSGVHSLGNMTVYDTYTSIPPEKIARALNSRLPESIRVLASWEAAGDFHPLAEKSIKTYEYRIYSGAIRPPHLRYYSYHITDRPDIEAMKLAGHCMEGEKDFAAFCAAGAQVSTTVREVYAVELEDRPSEDMDDGCYITIRVRGGGFLYNMVRIMAGTLLQVGRGKVAPDSIADIILSKDRRRAGPTLPPEGLFLISYDFI